MCLFGFPPELLDLCMCYQFSSSKDTVLVCKMVELLLFSSSCYGEFNYSSNDVIVFLKQYEEKYNNQTFKTNCFLETPDQLNNTMSNTEICSREKLTKNVKKEETICLETDGRDWLFLCHLTCNDTEAVTTRPPLCFTVLFCLAV